MAEICGVHLKLNLS